MQNYQHLQLGKESCVIFQVKYFLALIKFKILRPLSDVMNAHYNNEQSFLLLWEPMETYFFLFLTYYTS